MIIKTHSTQIIQIVLAIQFDEYNMKPIATG
jgi:hypothetical protein